MNSEVYNVDQSIGKSVMVVSFKRKLRIPSSRLKCTLSFENKGTKPSWLSSLVRIFNLLLTTQISVKVLKISRIGKDKLHGHVSFE